MSTRPYDAIVVGARCGGSPTAMLLARKGYKVLVVDRATFPSDTISTHLIHPPGVTLLRRWNLLDRLIATGCPPIDTYRFDLGPFALTGKPCTDEAPLAYAPRRTVLDKLLVEAAAEAGAEVREGFTVEEILFENDRVVGIRGHSKGGPSVTERARVVIGADGLNSMVAHAVNAGTYNEKPQLQVSYYSYWSGMPMHGRFEGYDRGDRAWAAWPTNDDQTLIIVGWPITEFENVRKDIETNFMSAFERAPDFRDRLAAARREDRFYGMAVPGFFRKPYGPGWALVGDAGYNKDFITAQGISDAFRQADLCATALDQAFSGALSFADAMAGYQVTRDEESLARFEFACGFAMIGTPPPPENLELFAAIQGNQEAMDAFVRMFAGVISPAEFFAPENVARMLSKGSSPEVTK